MKKVRSVVMMHRDKQALFFRSIYWLISIGIALLLLSAYQKVLDPEAFSLSVYRFKLLPDALVNVVSLYITWLELTLACCLLSIPRWRLAALWIVLGMLMLFTGGLMVNLLRGNPFSCGCFDLSPLAKPMSWLSVLRNLGLVLLVLLALFAEKKSKHNSTK